MVRSLFTLMLAVTALFSVTAQDINQATEAFNKTLELQTTDPQGAITSLKSCLEVCEQVGEDADDLKARAEFKLPELYYNVANAHLKAKSYTKAISAFEEAVTVSQEYSTPKVEAKANKMLPQLYNAVGGSYYKNKKYPEAIEILNKAISVDPNYAKAYYTMGLVYKKQKMLPEFEATMDNGLTAATKSKDNNYKKKIAKSGASTFLALAATSLGTGKAADADVSLNKALKYQQDNPEIYFYMASTQIELKQWDKALDAANKGLAVEKDDENKKAKHYYNMGMAYKGKGDTSSACAAFKNALFGQFKENAQYEIETELKCK